MRIMAGLMFFLHENRKVVGLLGSTQQSIGSRFWIGGVIELAGGLAIMLGMGTRIVVFICSGEMAVAYFQFRGMLWFSAAFFPVVNKGERAALYCFVFLFYYHPRRRHMEPGQHGTAAKQSRKRVMHRVIRFSAHSA